jgi:hypothetical protein
MKQGYTEKTTPSIWSVDKSEHLAWIGIERWSWDILMSVKVRVTFMPVVSTQSCTEGGGGHTKLIENYKEVGQDPELADRRDDYLAIGIFGWKTRIN